VGGQPHTPAVLARERPGTHCTGGRVGLRASLDVCEKSRLHRDSIPGQSISTFLKEYEGNYSNSRNRDGLEVLQKLKRAVPHQALARWF
jgi:hypothetical protein